MFVDIIEILLRGLCVGVASSITVGPVAVLCIQRTLSKSRRSGLASGVGVACGDTLMAIIAFFFYSMLQAQIEEYSVILQVIGGIFVVIVGVYIFFQNPVPQIRKNRAGRYNLWQDFSSMFVFTLANFVVVIPYILAFFAMFNVGMDGSEDVASLLRSGATIVGFFLGAVLWWIGLQFDWAAMQAVWGRRLLLAALVIGAAAVTYFAVMAVFGWRAQELRSAVAERHKK